MGLFLVLVFVFYTSHEYAAHDAKLQVNRKYRRWVNALTIVAGQQKYKRTVAGKRERKTRATISTTN